MSELHLHDACFEGIVLGGQDCTLYFRRPDSSRCEVRLIAIDALVMDDFRQGNIVSMLAITSGELAAPADHVLHRLYPPPHPDAQAEFHAGYARAMQQKRSALETGELTLAEMDPAYGATLLAMCQEVLVIER